MAGFRQEDVELHYEMGEELGRYVIHDRDDIQQTADEISNSPLCGPSPVMYCSLRFCGTMK